ncbi:hypothetical protein FDECE_668 [Fusarium decemcellulare]|nr:hypothetical protein FDECE_668 [Fusarium decemcellulare]
MPGCSGALRLRSRQPDETLPNAKHIALDILATPHFEDPQRQYSGVSWAINEGRKKVRLISDWSNPFASNAIAHKVPSVISYKDGRAENWGYDVGPKEEAFRWFKILLEPESQYSQEYPEVHRTKELLNEIGKTAQDIVSDYLERIWRYTKEDIRKCVGDDEWEINFTIHVVLTVPAMWSHLAKDNTLKAAVSAGLPENIQLVTEPEAAALATLRGKAEDNALREGDVFVVCDAGGGTVDLISYKVNKLKPLEIEECAIGDGGLCGSLFLNVAFEKYIKTLVGEGQYNRLRDKNKKDMMNKFENSVKRSFTADSTKDYWVDLRGVEDNEKEGIDDESITLKPWSAVCRGACLWGLEHANQFSEGTSRPSGNTPYPASTVSIRISKYSYGVAMAVPFDPKKHLRVDRIFDQSSNTYMADNQMNWLLRRGEKMTEGRMLSTNIVISVHGVTSTSKGSQQFRQTLHYCRESDPPTRLDRSELLHDATLDSLTNLARSAAVKELCAVRFSVRESTILRETSYTSASMAGDFRDMTFELMVLLGNARLAYAVIYKNKPLGLVEAEYMETF